MCGGLSEPPILAIDEEGVLESAERFDSLERATPQVVHARNPAIHAAGNSGQAACMPKWCCYVSCRWPAGAVNISRQLEELVRSCTA